MRQQSYSLNRIWFLLGIKIFLLFFLILRLGQLAIIQNPHYKTLAKGNRIHSRMLPAERGRILDCYGNVLAETAQTYSGYIYAKTREKLNTKLYEMEAITGKPVSLLGGFTQRRILPIKENLSWEDMAKLETYALPGIFVTSTFSRSYPIKAVFSHVLGYVSPPTAQDATFLQHPFLLVGHGGGIEQVYDDQLRGEMGFVEEEMDSKRRLVRILDTTSPQSGQDLKTTLDKDLQEFTYRMFEEEGIKSGGIVILDANTGAIKTLVSYPSHDANNLIEGISPSVWRELCCNSYRPLFNKVIQGQYAPGSIFKIIIALAALRSGLITEQTTCYCPGYMECGNRRFHCWAWRKGGHGTVDFYKAMANSCDVFFYQLAKKLKLQDVVDIATALGLGEKTGIDLMYEKKGLLPKKAWFKRRNIGEMLNLSIGQGRLLTTPIQLARMMAMIVNGGYSIKPFINEATLREPPIHIHLSGEHLNIVKKALANVINSPDGTGYQFHFVLPDGSNGFGGKTGTTQVSGISLADRASGNVNNKTEFLRDHALFVGFAPTDKPKYIISIILENAGWGTRACRIGHKILQYLLLHPKQTKD